MPNKFVVIVLDSVWEGDIFDTPNEPVIRGFLSPEADIRVFSSSTKESLMRGEVALGVRPRDLILVNPYLILVNLDRSMVQNRIGPRVFVYDNFRLLQNIKSAAGLAEVMIIGYTYRGLSPETTKKFFGAGLSRILDIGVLRILNPDNEALVLTA